jgi:hypothetical protein
MALDCDNWTLQFYGDGAPKYAPIPITPGTWHATYSADTRENGPGGVNDTSGFQYSGSNSLRYNFGQFPFSYTAPAGFKSVCTTNIPNPVIKRPSEHFDIKTYTGNGTTLTVGNTQKQTSAYQVNRGLRFRNGNSASLKRTPSAASNQRTWTWSAWVKRTDLVGTSNTNSLFGAFNSNADSFILYFSTNVLTIGSYAGGQGFSTTTTYTNIASWYHIVVAMDTTATSEVNRLILYINGVKQTALTVNNPSLNQQFTVNSTAQHSLMGASNASPPYYSDGYLAEVNFVDGQQLTATAFGQYDANNNWVPQRYTGTYGTNGFYLPFTNLGTSSYAALLSSSNYLTAPTNAAFSIGTANFTMETWFYPTNASQSGQFLFCASGGIQMGYQNSSTWGLCQANVAWQLTTGTMPTTGAWNHMAICRSGTGTNQTALFLNGVRIAQGTISTSYSQNTCVIGQGIIGYMSNTRMVKGTAVYDPANSTYTVPTAPLTNITNTSVLTFQNSTGIDNSSNTLTLTASGTVPYSVAYPFTTTPATNVAADSSGNGNHWTANNISTIADTTFDAVFDSPTDTIDSSGNSVGNFPVLFPVGHTLTNGNLNASRSSSSSFVIANSTLSFSNGMWYVEFIATNMGGGDNLDLGIVGVANALSGGSISGYAIGQYLTGYCYTGAGRFHTNNSTVATYTSLSSGNVVMMAVDLTNNKLYFGVNGTWVNSGNPAAGTGYVSTIIPGTYYVGIGHASIGSQSTAASVNFGQQPFVYTPPTGFKVLNTKNLKDVGSVNLPDSFGNVVNTPDLVWIKSRSGAYDHRIFDTVRGPFRGLVAGTTGAESAEVNGVKEFIPNGFSVGAAQDWNSAGATYAAWMWNRGKTPGFDIATYTGNGAAQTIPHNLGQTPAFMAVRNITNGTNSNWMIYHKSVGATAAGNFNGVGTFGASSSYWNDTAPGPTNFTVGNNANTSTAGISYIAYLWAEVPGFSKMGSYTGDGGTTGPFVHCGFRPKFVLLKCSSNTTSSTVWNIWDANRTTYNPIVNELYFPTAPAENVDSNGGDFYANGFKPKRNSEYANLSGWTYVYMAFAESPFKYANAR